MLPGTSIVSRSVLREPRFAAEMLHLNRPVKTISVLFFVYMIGWGIVDPLIPVYVQQMFGSYAAAGLVVSSFQFFSLFWALLLGPLLDRIQKKSLISTMLFLYLPLSPLLLSLSTLLHFILFRVYHSCIATALWATSDAYVRQHSDKHKEAESIGLFDFSVGLGQVVGGLLGAALIVYTGFSIFYAVSFFAAWALLISFFIPDTASKYTLFPSVQHCFSYSSIKYELQHTAANGKFRNVMIYSFPYFFAIALMPMSLPLLINYMGGALWMIGLISAAFFAPVLFESYFSTRKDGDTVMKLGMICAMFLFLALFFVQNIITVFILVLLLGISLAAVTPILSGKFTRCMPRKEIGEFSAVAYAIKSLAAALAPISAGLIGDILGLPYVFLLGSVMLLILLATKCNRC